MRTVVSDLFLCKCKVHRHTVGCRQEVGIHVPVLKHSKGHGGSGQKRSSQRASCAPSEGFAICIKAMGFKCSQKSNAGWDEQCLSGANNGAPNGVCPVVVFRFLHGVHHLPARPGDDSFSPKFCVVADVTCAASSLSMLRSHPRTARHHLNTGTESAQQAAGARSRSAGVPPQTLRIKHLSTGRTAHWSGLQRRVWDAPMKNPDMLTGLRAGETGRSRAGSAPSNFWTNANDAVHQHRFEHAIGRDHTSALWVRAAAWLVWHPLCG